ncbi:hypothetical protein ACJ41O_012740 [Fusarium nematophilum]
MSVPTPQILDKKTIVVAGAGMAGLAFAISLKKKADPTFSSPRLTVFDRDNRQLDPKRQGYSLSINGADKDGGLVALQNLGLLNRVMEEATPSTIGMPFRMWDGNWSELISVSAKPYGDLPVAGLRIPRKNLREILVEEAERLGIDIKWGSQCLSASSHGKEGICVTVSSVDETETSLCHCDILVAADGAHSKIRAALRPDDKLQYAGATQFGGLAIFSDGIPQPINDSWGILVSGYGNSCFVSPIRENAVVWALSKVEEMPSNQSGQALLEEARQHRHEIGEPFSSMLEATVESTAFVIPARDKRPFSHEDVRPGVIFIGDSNHAVSPFAGNGANTALRDGCDLAELLLSSSSVEDVVAVYDQRALPRALKTLKSSHWRIMIAHLQGVKFSMFRSMLMAGAFFKWLSGK